MKNNSAFNFSRKLPIFLLSGLYLIIILAINNCGKNPTKPKPNPEPDFEIGETTHIVSGGYHPKWSPDGSKVVYTTRYDNKVELWIWDVAADSAYAIVEGIDGDLTPTWSPDSKRIAFDAYESSTSYRMQIWIKNLDTGSLTRITNTSYSCVVPAWSNDGTRIAFHGNNEIKIYNFQTGNIASVPNTSGGSSPHWKFDDSQLVFTIGPEQENDIYIINTDGSDHQKITTYSGRDDRPQWSSDGDKIAYEVFNNNKTDIYLYFIESEERFLIKESSGNPAWSPDGNTIIFANQNGLSVIPLTWK